MKLLVGFPDEVVSWVGMASDYGNFVGEAGSDNLTTINDSGKTFKQIADIIESNPKGLFNEEVKELTPKDTLGRK